MAWDYTHVDHLKVTVGQDCSPPKLGRLPSGLTRPQSRGSWATLSSIDEWGETTSNLICVVGKTYFIASRVRPCFLAGFRLRDTLSS